MKRIAVAFPKKELILDILIHGYAAISLFNWIAFFTIDFWADSLYTIFGNHSIFYPFFGVLIADEMDAQGLAYFFILYWIINILLLSLGYIQAILRKKYAILLIVVFLDAVFTSAFTIANVLYGGLMSLHFFMLLGAILDFGFGHYLSAYAKKFAF